MDTLKPVMPLTFILHTGVGGAGATRETKGCDGVTSSYSLPLGFVAIQADADSASLLTCCTLATIMCKIAVSYKFRALLVSAA